MRAAVEAYDTLMRGRPDYGKETEEYAAGFTDTLSHLNDEQLAWLTHPTEGLHTVCKFLPTPADVFDFLREKQARLDAVKPSKTTYKKIEDDPDAPWNRETDFERKKRVVAESLGYNPEERRAIHRTVNAKLVPPTRDDLDNLKLKTPPGPITPQLRALLEQQDGAP